MSDVGFWLGAGLMFVVLAVSAGNCHTGERDREARALQCFVGGGNPEACDAALGLTDFSECMKLGGNMEACKAAVE